MGRPSVIRWSMIVLLCSLWGCTSSRSMLPFAWFRGEKKAEATAAKENPKESNPFKKDEPKKEDKPATDAAKTEAIAANTAPPEAAKTADNSPAAQTDAAKAPAAVSHDAQTLALIESELKDFSPEERAQFEKDLKGQDPALVRSILRAVRMTRQMSKSAPSQVAQSTGEDANNTVSPATATAGGDGRFNGSVSTADLNRPAAGLGTVQPWNHQTGGPAEPALNQQPLAALDTRNSTGDPYRTSLPYAVNGQSPNPPVDPHLTNNNGVTVDPMAFQATPANPNPQFQQQGRVGLYPDQTPPVNSAGYPNAYPNSGAQPPANSGMPYASNNMIHNNAVGNNFAGNVAPASNVPFNNTVANVGSNPTLPGIQVTGVYPLPPNQVGTQPPAANGQFPPIPATPPGAVNAKWNEDLGRLIAATETSLKTITPGTTDVEKQAYIEQQVYLRMLYLMSGQQQRAMEPIRDIAGADQEYWQQVFWALSNYFDDEVMPDPADRAAQTVAQLRSAVQRLEENARLELRNVNFCHKIASFGNYERFQRDEFSPNQDVLVYAEVNNFKSDATADGQYRTLLRSTIEIYKAGGGNEMVASIPFDPTPDLCYNHRRDYFHSYVVTIPANIGLGPYLLKLRVTDELSGKLAEYALKFTVK